MVRLPLCLTLLLGTVAAAPACTTSGGSFEPDATAVVCAPGATDLGPCCGHVAKEVSLADAGIQVCQGDHGYTLCDGVHFVCEYVCSVPAGYTVLASGGAASCPDAGGPEDARVDVPSSMPVPFDAGALHLGACSGDVVALIPAAACPDHCPGEVAYAVCDKGTYDECACNIPSGYTLVVLTDGPMPADASDARPHDATSSDVMTKEAAQ